MFPAALDSSSDPVAGELSLASFTCEKPITGKRANGTLTAAFSASGPADAALRVRFSGCGYDGALHMIGGRLDDGALGKAYVYRCRRSPYSALAVSCGPYLGTELEVTVRGNGWGRVVRVLVPPSFPQPPEPCDLQLAEDLSFDLADCRVGS
jgi:hypothetical protein